METNPRVLKALTYRVGGALITFLVVYIFTGKWAVATGVGVIDQFLSTIWYYFHDKYWDKGIRKALAKQSMDHIYGRFEHYEENK